MSTNKIIKNYANSFLDIVFEKDSFPSIVQEVEFIILTFEANPELKKIFENPIIKGEKKYLIFQEIFGKRISAEVLDFIKFLSQKNREELIYLILKKFIELKDERLGLAKVDVFTPIDLSQEQIEKLRLILEKMLRKKIIISPREDKTIIGGFIAKIGDLIIDASLKNQLELLKKKFKQVAVIR